MIDRNYIAAVLAAGTLVASFAATASELRIANAGDVRSLIPAGSTEPATVNPIVNIYEGLVSWDENGAVVPMLAEALPKVSQDGLTYVFKLRAGVKFHDGTPLTAKAAEKSWKYLLKPENGWVCRSYFDGSNNVKIDSIEATGPLELTVKLAKPAPSLLSQMARADCGEGGIMAEAMTDSPEKPKAAIGTGPYKLESIRPGRDITLVKFDQYVPRSEPKSGYAGKKEALIEKLVYVVIPDPAAAYAALRSGEIDVWPRIELRYLSDLQKASDISVSSAKTPSLYTLPFQTDHGPLANVALRRALNYAISRPDMVAALTEGRGTPSSSIVPASVAFYGPVQKNSFDQNLAKVKQLLKEANYKGEAIRITTNKNYPIMYETGVMVQGFLQAAGINAELEVVDFASQLPRYYNGDYHLMTFNYAPTLDPALMLDRITGDKKEAASKIWTNPEARKLVTKLLATPTAERQPIYDELHKLYLKDAPLMIWATGEVTDAYRKTVKGYRAWPGRTPIFWGVNLSK